MTGEKERRRDVCGDCGVNLAISAALLYQTHDILQSALLTGQTVKSPTRFLEGKQWIKIIKGKVRAETDRPFMIRDDQRLGLFKRCSLTATEDLQAHNLMSSDRVWLTARLLLDHLPTDCSKMLQMIHLLIRCATVLSSSSGASTSITVKNTLRLFQRCGDKKKPFLHHFSILNTSSWHYRVV